MFKDLRKAPVQSRSLMRILTVAKLLFLPQREVIDIGKDGCCGADAVEIAGDHGIVRGRVAEHLPGEIKAGGLGYRAIVRSHFRNDRVVPVGVDDDSLVFEVLCRRAEHCWPADVDLLNCIVECYARLGYRLLEGVEVHHHHVDRFDIQLFQLFHVLSIVGNSQQTGMNLRMQGLDPAIENLRKPGNVGNRTDGNPFPLQCGAGSSGRDNLDIHGTQRLCKFGETAFVRNTDERAAYVRQAGSFSLQHLDKLPKPSGV